MKILNLLKLFSIFCIILYPPSIVLALNTDREKPLHITSKSSEFNRKTGIHIFKENVIVTQGTTRLNADTITIYSNTERKPEKIIAVGKRAHYSTLLEEGKPYFHAFGTIIEYYPIKGEVILIGNAEAKQANSHIQGHRIIYDIRNETVTTPANTNTKTSIVLQPEQFSDQ